MDTIDKKYDCSRGCEVDRFPNGELKISYKSGCCKLHSFDWMEGISQEQYKDMFEVRFKNTHKGIYRNESGQLLKKGDIVVVEAANGHDIGIITLEGPVVMRQMVHKHIDPKTYEFRKIYRKAKILDIERWQEAIAREHQTMIRARQLAARLGLNMKIGDVEFQGDGTKAIFYYIADERVDFRQLIKDFAEEFHIRIEMKQIGARQEAGLIGGIGVCGRTLCCSRYMTDFQSITTQAARCQDLSLNPQKLAGQCSKLKCCINYEASVYLDAAKSIPDLRGPIELADGPAYLMKTDTLRGLMYFSYEQGSMAKLHILTAQQVKDIIAANRKGVKPESIQGGNNDKDAETGFVSAVGDESISRFDSRGKKNGNHHKHSGKGDRRANRSGGKKSEKGGDKKNERPQ
ncbi:MAG: hypothetical protein KBT00_05220 [Bacteroidales bacterium]|nr:hypothetical protein [Candidatus Cacconaster merdequi]